MTELIKKAILKFTKSGSQDVAGYALYMEEVPDVVSYSSQRFDLGNPPFDENGVIEIDLTTLPGMTTKDGIYNFGLTTVDDVGNESSILTDGLQNISLDFVAPDPPTDALIYYN